MKQPGRYAFAAIFFTVLIDIIGFGIVIPVFPSLIVEITGLSLSDAAPLGGYLLFVFALTQFISSPILGGLSDRFGRRPVILFSLFGYAADFAIMGLASSFAILFVGRLLSGSFAATYSTANAYIADITPIEKRAQRFGFLGAAFGLGFIIGPGIGGLLGSYFGPRAPFFAASALAVLNLVYCYFLLPETLAPEKRRRFEWRRANPLGNLVQLRQYPVMLPVLLTIFLFQISQFSLQTTWSWISLEKFAWTEAQIGLSLMAVGLSAAIVQGGLLRYILPVTGERLSVFLGGLAMFIAYIIYAFAPVGWMVYPAIAIGAFGALAQPAMQSVMSRTIPPDAQGELQGAIASILSIAMMVGPILMTQIFSKFSSDSAAIHFPGAPFLLAAALVIMSGIPALIAFSKVTGPDPLKNPEHAATTDEDTNQS